MALDRAGFLHCRKFEDRERRDDEAKLALSHLQYRRLQIARVCCCYHEGRVP